MLRPLARAWGEHAIDCNFREMLPRKFVHAGNRC
jgi:hypothetical protein